MAKGVGKKDARAARDRSRVYQARQQFHDGTVRRRTRDNLVAGIAGGALILAVIGGQVLYFTAGPGAPTPEPTTSMTPTPTAVPSETPAPSESPASTDSPSPEPTSTP
ncbi:dioxygenase [Microbacterium sp. bgisy189]|uniref:dioxygenase n=1 Tax=Microbacterium sp. bgisy189 TaxID=3413798 RepID=UPI003EB6FF2E